MKFVIVYDKVLKTYKTCLLDDAEGCDILVQFDASGYNEALSISEDYFKDTKIDPEQIRCKESLNEYIQQQNASLSLQDQNAANSVQKSNMDIDREQTAIKQKALQDEQEELIRSFNPFNPY